MHDESGNYGRLFESTLEAEKRILEQQIRKPGTYLTDCEAELLQDKIQKEQTKSLAAYTKSASELSGNVPSRRDHYGIHLKAAKSKLMQILLIGGVFVPPHLATEYPWDEISRTFGDTNYELLMKLYLGQAESRFMVTIVTLRQFLPYADGIVEFRLESVKMWPNTKDKIREKKATANANNMPQFQSIVQEEVFKAYGELIIVSEHGMYGHCIPNVLMGRFRTSEHIFKL